MNLETLITAVRERGVTEAERKEILEALVELRAARETLVSMRGLLDQTTSERDRARVQYDRFGYTIMNALDMPDDAEIAHIPAAIAQLVADSKFNGRFEKVGVLYGGFSGSKDRPCSVELTVFGSADMKRHAQLGDSVYVKVSE